MLIQAVINFGIVTKILQFIIKFFIIFYLTHLAGYLFFCTQ
jgi:hypothetical protein